MQDLQMSSSQEAAAIKSRYEAIKADLAAWARDPEHPPVLLPVTKTQPLSRILCLPEWHITGVGENRVQEICEKFTNFAANPPIHLIGQLQSNKVKYIIDRVCMVQSLDRPSLAQELDRQAQRVGRQIPVLVQVNIGNEPQKGGLPLADVPAQVRAFARLPGLHVCGLMAVMPICADLEALRPLFAAMRGMYDRLGEDAIDKVDMSVLSMGMSADARIAAQEGSTLVRIGSAIFGPRL